MSSLTAPSVLDPNNHPNNPANYKPLIVEWDVQGKHGKGWTWLGTYKASNDVAACRKARQVHKYSAMRVRAASTLGVNDKWRRIRFK
jgi:hypothetical protein